MSAAAKVARMLESPKAALDPRHPPGQSMDGSPEEWHPAHLSDQSLLALKDRLERVRRLGGPFAQIEFSDVARARLDQLVAVPQAGRL